MLQEVQLLVRCGRPEVLPLIRKRFFVRLSLFIHNGDAALLAERRIGQHHVEPVARIGSKTVANNYRTVISANAMQEHIHHTETRRCINDLPTLQLNKTCR